MHPSVIFEIKHTAARRVRVGDPSYSHLQAQAELQRAGFSIGALTCAEVFAIGFAAECACCRLLLSLAHACECFRVAITAGVRPEWLCVSEGPAAAGHSFRAYCTPVTSNVRSLSDVACIRGAGSATAAVRIRG